MHTLGTIISNSSFFFVVSQFSPAIWLISVNIFKFVPLKKTSVKQVLILPNLKDIEFPTTILDGAEESRTIIAFYGDYAQTPNQEHAWGCL